MARLTLRLLPKNPPEVLELEVNKRFADITSQLNGLTEGMVHAVHNADTVIPSAGTHQAGDIVRRKSPAEEGTAGSKYVIIGWICITSGTPGTWKEMRTLTGG